MPIYDYSCTACQTVTEVVHGIHEAGPRFCPACGAEGTMKKAFASPAIHFKGSGWAKKDRGASARTKAAAKASGTGGSSDSSGSSESSGSSGKSGSGDSGSSESTGSKAASASGDAPASGAGTSSGPASSGGGED